jgi:hypothetical protein
VCTKFWSGKQGKRPFGKPRCRREDNIRMDLREIRWEDDWNHVAQDSDPWLATVNTIINLWVP